MTFTSEKPLQTFIICNFYVIFCKFRIKNEKLKLSKRGRGLKGGGGRGVGGRKIKNGKGHDS